MREKKNWVVISFKNTTDAMKMEQAAKISDAPGRMIPLPTQISAGCGLAWRAEVAARGELEKLISENDLTCEDIVELYY